MKTLFIYLLLISNIAFMCKNDSVTTTLKKTDTNTSAKTENTTSSNQKSQQKSCNYDALFSGENDIFLSFDEIAKATGLPVSAISKGDTENFNKHYFYTIKLPNGEEMQFDYYISKMSKEDVNREIKNYLKLKKRGENKITGTDIEISKTGDCYLTHQKKTGRLMVMNPNYDNILLSSWARLAIKMNNEQKEIRIEQARKILNYLIEKYRK